MGPSGLSGLRSALTPVDSCAEAHLPTVVLRRLVLRHGPRCVTYLAVSHVLKSQNQIFPRQGPPYPTATPPHPAGVALRAAVRTQGLSG